MAIIDKPSEHFNTKLYTGTGATNAITGVNFQPNFTWIKDRGSNSHRLTDSVRGATKILYTDLNYAEATDAQTLQSFNTDGFTLGTNYDVNGSGLNFASWNWLGGGTAVSNTDGSITSSVSANTTSGFSVVSFTGDGSGVSSVGHGLGITPKLIIGKNRDSSGATYGRWLVGGSAIPSFNFTNDYMVLNSSGAKATDAGGTVWHSAPTSIVVNFADFFNTSTNKYIMYCFADTSMIKCGSFVSNNTSDNAFIYTGFKPALLIAKSTTSANDWVIHDNTRNTFNPVDKKLYPDLSNAEDTEADWDFLSNGLKLRAGGGANTYIYLAIAEQPFVTSTDNGSIPATAR